MQIVVLQCLVAALTLSFGAAALAIARRLGGESSRYRDGWLLTGVAFALLGANGVLHTSAAAWAFLAGPGTEVYREFLRWSPMANHSRSTLLIGYTAVLGVLTWRGRRAHAAFWPVVGGILLVSAAVGGLLGALEGPLSASRHLPAVAVIDTVVLVVLFAALLGGVGRGVDRLLWICLTIYGVRLALSILWSTARAWVDVEGAWYPSGRDQLLISAIAWVGMLALALYRYRLAHRDQPVPALLEPLEGSAALR